MGCVEVSELSPFLLHKVQLSGAVVNAARCAHHTRVQQHSCPPRPFAEEGVSVSVAWFAEERASVSVAWFAEEGASVSVARFAEEGASVSVAWFSEEGASVSVAWRCQRSKE
jgi:hypothetical protein